MAHRSRTFAMWTIAVAIVGASVAVVWTVIGMKRDAAKLLDRGPSVPAPSAQDAAETPATREPTRITVKQRGDGWLPGGTLRLHIGDITGGQVLVSVTDRDQRVVHGPRSVREGDAFTIAGLRITVARLENMLVGSGDFAEFDVTLASPATQPAP
jgi:hypothetical protein